MSGSFPAQLCAGSRSLAIIKTGQRGQDTRY